MFWKKILINATSQKVYYYTSNALKLYVYTQKLSDGDIEVSAHYYSVSHFMYFFFSF